MYLSVILECVNQISYRTFIEEGCPSRVKKRSVGKAGTAAMVSAYSNKWNSADRAKWRRDRWQAVKAGWADMEFAGVRNKGVTYVADRGEKNVKQRGEELLDGKHLETEICVYHQYMEVSQAWSAINNCGNPTEAIR